MLPFSLSAVRYAFSHVMFIVRLNSYFLFGENRVHTSVYEVCFSHCGHIGVHVLKTLPVCSTVFTCGLLHFSMVLYPGIRWTVLWSVVGQRGCGFGGIFMLP